LEESKLDDKQEDHWATFGRIFCLILSECTFLFVMGMNYLMKTKFFQ
jgi:hypothetical protein